MQLSQKPKGFSGMFFAFLKYILNVDSFRKKDDPHSWCISKIMNSEKRD